MPVAPNRTRRGHGGGRPRKPNPRPVRYIQTSLELEIQRFFQCPDRSSSLLQLLIVYGMILMLNLLIKFRLEYLYPIVLLIQEVHNLWKCSTLSRYLSRKNTISMVKNLIFKYFFSFFFLLITFSTDLALYMVTDKQDWLFMIAGFLVWIQVQNLRRVLF